MVFKKYFCYVSLWFNPRGLVVLSYVIFCVHKIVIVCIIFTGALTSGRVLCRRFGAQFCLTLFCRMLFIGSYRLAGLLVKASASGAEDPGFESRLRWDFFRVESYLKNWHSSGYPARPLAL